MMNSRLCVLISEYMLDDEFQVVSSDSRIYCMLDDEFQVLRLVPEYMLEEEIPGCEARSRIYVR